MTQRYNTHPSSILPNVDAKEDLGHSSLVLSPGGETNGGCSVSAGYLGRMESSMANNPSMEDDECCSTDTSTSSSMAADEQSPLRIQWKSNRHFDRLSGVLLASVEADASTAAPVIDGELCEFRVSMPDIPSIIGVQYICESASRLLFQSIHWVKTIQAFNDLPYDTQVCLVRNSWTDLFVLGLAQCSSYLNLDGILGSILSHLQRSVTEEIISVSRIRPVTSTVCRIQQFVRISAVNCGLGIDNHEFAYLKAICLFDTDQLGLLCPRGIEQLRNNVLRELRAYCLLRDATGERFSHILMRIAPLRSMLAENLEEIFFSGLIGCVQIHSVIPYILKMESTVSCAEGSDESIAKETTAESDLFVKHQPNHEAASVQKNCSPTAYCNVTEEIPSTLSLVKNEPITTDGVA